MSNLDSAIVYAKENQEEFLEDLISYLRISSVSTLPEHEPDMQRAAKWTADQLLEFGFESVAVMPTSGHPVVYGEWLKAGTDVPTILFYGHYDVQPPDPLDLWISEPFEPQVRGDNIFARGASDMKGQVVAHLKAGVGDGSFGLFFTTAGFFFTISLTILRAALKSSFILKVTTSSYLMARYSSSNRSGASSAL